jgi:hypothetical protein
MIMTNLALIPAFGIIGAAVAAAVTTVICNFWCLKAVRTELRLSPYNRGYVRLIGPAAAALLTCALLRSLLGGAGHGWLPLAVSVPAAYLAFISVLVFGLDADDRLVLNAVLRRVTGAIRVAQGTRAGEEPAVVAHAHTAQVGSQHPRQRPPFFIVGPSRSGTTLLARMLNAHPAAAVFPETWCYVTLDRLHCMEVFQNRWQYILFLNSLWDNLRQFDDPAAAVLAEQAARRPSYTGPTRPILECLGNAYAEARSAEMWGEKTPGHILWLSEIHRLFPQARILVCIRDPRDIIASYDERWGASQHDTAYLMQAAAQVRRYLAHLLSEPGFKAERVMWVRYEALTAAPAVYLEEISRFLGLNFHPDMLHFYAKGAIAQFGPADPQHHRLLSRPVTRERVGRYRETFSAAQISLIEKFLADEMAALEYCPEFSCAPRLSRQEVRAWQHATELYRNMCSGAVRRRIHRHAQLRLAAYRCFGQWLAAASGKQLAITSQDWEARVQQYRVERGSWNSEIEGRRVYVH